MALALVVVPGLTLSACGGSSDDSERSASGDGASSTSTPSDSASSAPTTAPGSSTEPSTDPSNEPSSEPSTEPSTEPTATPEPTPRVIAYAGGESIGVEVNSRADAKKLRGAPASFKRFAGDTAAKLVAKSTCDSAAVGLTVETLRTDGFAVGGVNDCGGYQALWAIVDGQWKEIEGTQDTWDCQVLERYQVPSDVVGETCYDYHGDNKEHRYRQS